MYEYDQGMEWVGARGFNLQVATPRVEATFGT